MSDVTLHALAADLADVKTRLAKLEAALCLGTEDTDTTAPQEPLQAGDAAPATTPPDPPANAA